MKFSQMTQRVGNRFKKRLVPFVNGVYGKLRKLVSGNPIVITDASDESLAGLRVFGKSTQDGTPTPDAPVEIMSVENPTVVVCGKNLYSGGDISGVKSSPVNITTIPKGTYTISANVNSTDEEYEKSLVLFYYVDDSGYTAVSLNHGEKAYASVSFDKPINQIGFYASINASSSENDNFSFSNIQIEIGDIATDYEPYTEQTLSITRSLHGIPVTSGGNYTDANGQQWICDEVDFERGVYVQRIKQLLMDGSEPWKLYSNKYIYLTIDDVALEGGNGFCTCVPYHYSYAGDGIFAIENVIYLGEVLTQKLNGDITTWTNILTTNPAKLYYILTTPIEIPLTTEQIAAYKALHANKSNTTILNDQDAWMEVSYIAK